MPKKHHYTLSITWTGNLGTGTSAYRAYSRNHEVQSKGKPIVPGSSDPSFRGDPARYNPEELFVSTLSSCHMLWVLHLCSVNKITVVAYEDHPEGIMVENKDGSGHFEEVVLKPKVSILEADKAEMLDDIHHQAHALCFIAASVKCDVRTEGKVEVVES